MNAMPHTETMRKALEKRQSLSCKHYTGIQNKCCAKGIVYQDLIGNASSLPCLPRFTPSQPPQAECELFEAKTRDEIAAETRMFAEHSRKINQARAGIAAETKGKRGVRGAFPCPVCKDGMLSYSVARCNGHIHAQCSSEDCVAWME